MAFAGQPNNIQLIAHYEREYDHLLSIGHFYGIGREELKDIIQQLFLHFAERNVDLGLISNPHAYIVISFKRRLIDSLRQSARQSRNIGLVMDDCPDLSIDQKIEENESQMEMVHKLKAIYDKLPPRCKKVIYLKYYEGLSNNEIVSRTGLSMRSVYNNLSEGIKIMRAEMMSRQSQQQKFALKNLLPYIF